MTEWTELKTLQDVAAAQARGDEIQVYGVATWVPFEGKQWFASSDYRSRPAKKTKTIVLREALFRGLSLVVTGLSGVMKPSVSGIVALLAGSTRRKESWWWRNENLLCCHGY